MSVNLRLSGESIIETSSNGMPLLDGHGFDLNVEELFAAGLNTLALDAYRGLPVADHARKTRK